MAAKQVPCKMEVMQVNLVANRTKRIVPAVALAAALTFGSPFACAGEKAGLVHNRAEIKLASKIANPWLQERRLLVDAGLQNPQKRNPLVPAPIISWISSHEETETARLAECTPEVKEEAANHDEGKEGKVPWWLRKLIDACATVSISLFYLLSIGKVLKTKNTESFSKASVSTSLIGTSLWVGYGICINDWLVAGWPALLLPGYAYLTIQKWVNKDKMKPMAAVEKKISRIVIGTMVLAFTAFAAAQYLLGNKGLGILATGLGFMAAILRNISPWAQTIKTVIDKSTKSFNLLYTVLSLPLVAPWVVYGWIQNEMPVMITHLLGIVLGSIVAWIKVKNWKEGK